MTVLSTAGGSYRDPAELCT